MPFSRKTEVSDADLEALTAYLTSRNRKSHERKVGSNGGGQYRSYSSFAPQNVTLPDRLWPTGRESSPTTRRSRAVFLDRRCLQPSFRARRRRTGRAVHRELPAVRGAALCAAVARGLVAVRIYQRQAAPQGAQVHPRKCGRAPLLRDRRTRGARNVASAATCSKSSMSERPRTALVASASLGMAETAAESCRLAVLPAAEPPPPKRSTGSITRNLLALTLNHLADLDTMSKHDSIVHAAPMSHGSRSLLTAACGSSRANESLPNPADSIPKKFISYWTSPAA